MVTPARVERATYRLGGGCSIHLSYGADATEFSKASDRDRHNSAVKLCHRSVSFQNFQINLRCKSSLPSP